MIAGEVDLFARCICIRLKPDSVEEFTRIMEEESGPLLRKQKGFRDEMTLVTADGREAIGISLWDREEDADAYGESTYSELLKALAEVMEGSPRVRTDLVCSSTFHSIPARAYA